MSIVGYIGVAYLLEPVTEDMYEAHLIEHHTGVPGADEGGH